jgi:hypothetical protein
MEITVEIGTQERQVAIAKELSALTDICNMFDPPLALREIIVPSDFDRTVNEKQASTTYKSERTGHVAVAKVLRTGNEYTLVLSPDLYAEQFDALCRAFLYFHEIVHVYDGRNSARISPPDSIPRHYIGDLYAIFGEYRADRKAYELIDAIFPEQSVRYRTFVAEGLKGHVDTLANDQEFYCIIKEEVASFRRHGNADRFIESARGPYHEVAMALVHAYAGLDHFSIFAEIGSVLSTSRFHDEKAIQLMAFIRAKYAEGAGDLIDGIPLFEAFLSNFRFEVLSSGALYCHVIGI